MMNEEARIDQIRYRRILTFFGGVLAHFLWWELTFGRIPLVRGRAISSRPRRLQQIARDFRGLAIEMGGVMIKLGQFLSTRVDILPEEITRELQGLQDEVPAADSREVFALLEHELGDIDRRFAYVEREPIAAASLGQVYRAQLLPDPRTGEPGPQVVVKIQRPHIATLVQTDLAALRVVSRWVMRYQPIRRRANVPALMEEFALTLWEELDYESEADNADRFAQMHADNEQIYIPYVYRQHSTARVVVLEDVESLKVTDMEGMTAAGIDPKEVADLLLEAYFEQVFIAEFFHADPHPGNLFVRPTAGTTETGSRSFQLIFIDFGMAVTVPKAISENLRKVVIGVTQQDGRQLVDAFRDLGFFLPGADMDRVTEATETVLGRVWGRNLLELAQPDPKEVEELGREFRDLLFEFPFQVPQDFIYLGRALSMISGLVSQLDPLINPFSQIERYGEALIRSQNLRQLNDLNWQSVVELIRPYLETPFRIQRLLEDAEKGRLKVQYKADPQTLRHQERMEKRMSQLSMSIVAAAGLVSAALVYISRNRRSGD